MKKSLVVLVACMLLMSTALAACQPAASQPAAAEPAAPAQPAAAAEPAAEPAATQDAVVAINAPPSSYDLITSSAASTQMIGYHIYEMLIAFNASSDIVPVLATEWDNQDDTVFTFQLRQGVKFHDGTDFTAEDVIASFERYNRCGYRKDKLFALVDSWEAVDDYTVKITLREKAPMFLYELALPGFGPAVIMPAEVCKPEYDEPNLPLDKLIGTGPYMMTEIVADDHILMTKFQDYVAQEEVPASGFVGNRVAHFDTVNFKIVPEKAQRLNGLVAGEYDYVEELDITMYDQLESDPGLTPKIVSPSWIPCAILNCISGPVASKEFRQAMVYAIDYEQVLIAATGNNPAFYELDPSIFYNYQVWHTDSGSDMYFGRDLEKAKELIATSGYNGETLLWATTKDYEWMYQIAVVVQAQLAEVGVNIELQINDWPTQASLLVNGSLEKDWDIFSTGFSLFDQIDPSGMNGLLLTPQVVLPYVSAEMDEAMVAGISTSDPAARKAAYDKMEALTYQDVPYLVFGKTNALAGATAKMAGEEPWFVTRMWNVWFTE